MERKAKGIWIPIEIWEDKNLNWNEKILFLEIDSYTSRDSDCYISNEYIAKLLGVTETSANKILSSLISKGYVVKTKFDGRKRYIKTNMVYRKSVLPYEASQPCRLEQPCIAAESNILIQSTNTDTNYKEEIDKSISKKEGIDFDSIVSAWNEIANEVDEISSIRGLTDKRKKQIMSLLKACNSTCEELVRFIKTLPYADDWVIGKGDRKWSIDFDWLIQNTSNWYVAGLEGNMHKKNRYEFDKIMRGEEVFKQSKKLDGFQYL